MLDDPILIVNTDEADSRGATERMLSMGIIAVWGGGGEKEKALKQAVDGPGQVVYAYKSGVGLVARGTSLTGKVTRSSSPTSIFPECKDNDCWELDVDWLDKPLNSLPVTDRETREKTSRKVSNPRAVHTVRDPKLARYLSSRWGKEEHRVCGIIANPTSYDIEGAISNLKTDTWTLPKGELETGDYLVFWKAKGMTRTRGVVALGEVLEPAKKRPPLRESGPFWTNGLPDSEERRVLIRYIVPEGFPLWLEPEDQPFLKQLTLSTGQGSKLYRVPRAQWKRILEVGGGLPTKRDIRHTEQELLNGAVDELLDLGALARPSYPQEPAPLGIVSGPGQKHRGRREDVKAWVLQQAQGVCECCGQHGPFLTRRGVHYLEVHHVKNLSNDGPDTVENCVAVCPNCHKLLHYSAKREAAIDSLYLRVERLIDNRGKGVE